MTNDRHLRRRPGSLVMATLICITFVAVLAGAWMRLVTHERQQARQQQAALEAEFLAESGLRRAAAHLNRDAEYQGETWQVDTEQRGGAATATVTITVEKFDDAPGRRNIHVQARRHGGATTTVVRSRQSTMELSSEEPRS